MSKPHPFEVVLFALNSLGLLAYFFWLVYRAKNIMYTQEGVLYLLPCLPFFFVYFWLFQKRRIETPEEKDHRA